MREFAEAEIVVPSGPYAGMRFRCDRQPYSKLFFDAVDSGTFNRFASLGPAQSGKTLTCWITPTLYHLFEVQEKVICFIPTMDVAEDKWREDLLPAIEVSRYRELLPTSGAGSRGGKFNSITFQNGCTLKFMSGHGGDEKRSAFESRVVVGTEIDKCDQAGEASREADPITQVETRTNSHGHHKRIYLECTVSVTEGRIWQEWLQGTQSRIALPCPHCSEYVSPEREHLAGFADADNEVDAREQSALYCPSCGEAWTEEQRHAANLAGRLVHRGQEINAAGEVSGDAPKTYTLGFRWNAANNSLVTMADVAQAEYQAARDVDHEDGEKRLRQFFWAMPYQPPVFDDTPLDFKAIRQRADKLPRGLVPGDTQCLTLGLDLRKRFGHWVLIAWRKDHRGHVVDYAAFDVPSDDLGVEIALPKALRDFRDRIETGWTCEGVGTRVPDTVWIDSNYQQELVFDFTLNSGSRYFPVSGRGADEWKTAKYQAPRSTNEITKELGEGYHIELRKDYGVFLVVLDANYWKSWLHARLATPSGQAGALTLFSAMPAEHTTFAKHMTSEKAVEEFVPGKGRVIKWITQSRSNHWLDAAYYAAAASNFCGWSLTESPSPIAAAPQPAEPPPTSLFLTPSGAPFVATER